MTSLRMRDVFIEALTSAMRDDPMIFFLSADFGSPKLDELVASYPDRFINVGIAEQNLVNVAAGLALEGHKVFAYAIAPFITMRCYEQVRINLALMSQLRPLNVNLVGVGAGLSYDVSGPTHQALEDVAIMRAMPNIQVLSPADWVCARAMVSLALGSCTPKYLRMDSKPLPSVYEPTFEFDWQSGFHVFQPGADVYLAATGYMTHKALAAARILAQDGIQAGVVDMFTLHNVDGHSLAKALKGCRVVLSLEEGFGGTGGLAGLLSGALTVHAPHIRLDSLGLERRYSFQIGDRDTLLAANGLDEKAIAGRAKGLLL